KRYRTVPRKTTKRLWKSCESSRTTRLIVFRLRLEQSDGKRTKGAHVSLTPFVSSPIADRLLEYGLIADTALGRDLLGGFDVGSPKLAGRWPAWLFPLRGRAIEQARADCFAEPADQTFACQPIPVRRFHLLIG